MIPLKDETPRRSFPWITVLLIIVNILVFAYQLELGDKAGDAFVKTWGLVPWKIQVALAGHRFTMEQALLPLITCMFLHGGFLHIIGNMWFLWIFGGNVEDRLGPVKYLIFYFICGVGSGIAQVIFTWGSHVPSIGASGAISGVLGAYFVFFPRSQILTLVPLFIIFFTWKIPAVVFIGLWFVMQFMSGLGSLGGASTGGIAVWAHIGGFLLGALIAGSARMFGRSAAQSY